MNGDDGLFDGLEEAAQLVEVLDVGTCRRCHRPIIRTGKHWWHLDRTRAPALTRSCRAATGDQSLPRHWEAKP